MLKHLLASAMAIALLAAPAFGMKPPREESPAPEELLRALGDATEEAELQAAIAAADRHPLGTAENPVRVGGPEGERAYMARLRCADGNAPKVGQRGSAGVGAFGTIVDVYPLDCGASAPGRTDLVMDMYHSEHVEDRAPAGFAIARR
ncbi:MAG TPA: hypothetical protein VGE84_04240 [Allosphingosinicella sp.]